MVIICSSLSTDQLRNDCWRRGRFFVPFPIKWVGLLVLKRNTCFLSKNGQMIFFWVGCKMDRPLGGSSHLVSKSPRPGVVHLPNAIFMACKRVWSKTLILSIGMILQVEKWLGYRHQHKLGLGSAGHSIVFPLNENKSGFGWLLATRVVGTLKINLTQFFNPGRFPKVTNFWWSFEVVNNFWWIIRDWNYRERGNWDFFCFTRTTPPQKK